MAARRRRGPQRGQVGRDFGCELLEDLLHPQRCQPASLCSQSVATVHAHLQASLEIIAAAILDRRRVLAGGCEGRSPAWSGESGHGADHYCMRVLSPKSLSLSSSLVVESMNNKSGGARKSSLLECE
jgi:hypothetical protein